MYHNLRPWGLGVLKTSMRKVDWRRSINRLAARHPSYHALCTAHTMKLLMTFVRIWHELRTAIGRRTVSAALTIYPTKYVFLTLYTAVAQSPATVVRPIKPLQSCSSKQQKCERGLTKWPRDKWLEAINKIMATNANKNMSMLFRFGTSSPITSYSIWAYERCWSQSWHLEVCLYNLHVQALRLKNNNSHCCMILLLAPVGLLFGRPFVKRFALCYRTVVCLPVCL